MVGGRSRGTTFAEMLVVVGLFSLLMVLILSVYIEGEKVTRRQDKTSASYRRVITAVERIEELLANSRIYRVLPETKTIVFGRLPETAMLADGMPAWPGQADTLWVEPADRESGRKQRLVLVRGGAPKDLMILESQDNITFGWDEQQGLVTVTASSRIPVDVKRQEGEGRVVQVSRYILAENFERF